VIKIKVVLRIDAKKKRKKHFLSPRMNANPDLPVKTNFRKKKKK
jgi:hypothetical protein